MMDIIIFYIGICYFPFQHCEGDQLSLNIYCVVPTLAEKLPIKRPAQHSY